MNSISSDACYYLAHQSYIFIVVLPNADNTIKSFNSTSIKRMIEKYNI